MELVVRIKKLDEKVVVPKYETSDAAGMDLTAVSEKAFFNGSTNYVEYGTGLAFEIPRGYIGIICPRSSISSNTSTMLSNSIGIIDADFRGEVKLRFRDFLTAGNKRYKIGDRIGQLIIIPYPKVELLVVDELSDTTRGSEGFGHTGK